MTEYPSHAREWLREAQQFWTRLRALKAARPLEGGDWYPYDSLSALPLVGELLAPHYQEIRAAGGPVADLGCGDGDFALLFASWGLETDAIDYAPNNYNRMQGVRTLARLLDVPVRAFSLDLDARAELPRELYGLTLFLGTLYHLKNPYGALESLAYRTRWCVLSTRIAQRTPRTSARMEGEPLAYLADGREIANDATNYWIFSAAGLLRLAQRTRWAIAGMRRAGCAADSNPIAADADERMFLLLKSRVLDPGLRVSLGEGWYDLEEGFRWTAPRFWLEVVLPLETPAAGFVLEAYLPEAAFASGESIRICCRIAGELVADVERRSGGRFEIPGALPPFAAHEPLLRLEFTVENVARVARDARELGVCVPADGGQPAALRVE